MVSGTLYLDNIIFSLQKTGGISIVWYELIKHLMDRGWGKELRFLEFNHAGDNLFRKHLSLPAEQIINKHYLFMPLQRYLNPHIENVRKFIFHSSYYRTCPSLRAINVTTVHDFTYEHYMHGLVQRLHSIQKYNAIRRSTHIICISNHTKRDLLRFLPEIDPERISVIYNGVSKEYHVLSERPAVPLPYDAFSFVLFVGSRVAYKNFGLAVRALRQTGLRLVIVGDPLTREETNLLHTELDGLYHYAGRLSNKRLNEFYNAAYCLLYPSSYEGFGIPVIEAQKAGCPVIALNASSIPEIIGNKSLLLKEATVEEIRRCLSQVQNSSVRAQIVRDGLENAKRFTWDNTFAQIEKLYARLLAG